MGPLGNGATLITCFAVAEGREEAFLAAWYPINSFMIAQPGYLDHSLHHAIASWSHYRFVNVAHWRDGSSLEHALRSDSLKALLERPEMDEFPSTPGIFGVCHQGSAQSGI